MSILRKPLFLIGCLFPVFANAETLSQYSFRSANTPWLQEVADRFEIISRNIDVFEVLVPIERSGEFLQLMPNAELITDDIHAEFRTTEGLRTPKGYRDLKMVNEYIYSLAQKFPKIVKIESYGTTESGLPLLLLKVSDNVNESEQEPKVIIDAGTHGDEAIGVEVLLRAIDDLLTKYGTEPRETKIVDSLELTFVPVVNPEGYSRFERYSRGVDPNRDYPWPGKPEKKSVACIASLRDLFDRYSYQGSLTLHAYGKLVMFPWGYTAEPISDHAKRSELEQLSAQMAEHNGYKYGSIAKTIYVAKGSSADYYYWKHNTTAIAIELGSSKAPPEAEIPQYVMQVRESIWRFMEHFKMDKTEQPGKAPKQ